MTLTKVTPRGIEYDLWFDDNPSASPGGIAVGPVEQGARVVWYFNADFGNNPFARWFGLLIDPMIGADFERGLRKLDELLARQPP